MWLNTSQPGRVRRLGYLAVSVLCASFLSAPAAAQCELEKITPLDQEAGDYFGQSIAVSGKTMIVGSPRDDDLGISSGSAYIFQCTDSGWLQQAKLRAVDGRELDQFGLDVDIDGDVAIVGGRRFSGAYIYRRNALGQWILEALIGSSYFPVAISGDFAAVGRDFGFEFYHFDGIRWEFTQFIEGPSAGSAAMDGRTLVVGNGKRLNQVTIYNRTKSGWAVQAQLEGSGWFGQSVAVSGDRVVIGEPRANSAGPLAGAVHVYRRLGDQWLQEALLVSPTPLASSLFGISVAIQGEAIVVGGNQDGSEGGDRPGSAYVFARDPGGGSGWTAQSRLEAFDWLDNENFGVSIAISGEIIAVGADYVTPKHKGAAYTFTIADGRKLSLSPPRPGSAGQDNLFTASQGTPGDVIYFVYAFGTGQFAVPGCPGVTLDVGMPRLLGSRVTEPDGRARLQVFVPSGARGRRILFQAFDPAACTVSNLVTFVFN